MPFPISPPLYILYCFLDITIYYSKICDFFAVFTQLSLVLRSHSRCPPGTHGIKVGLKS